MAPNRENTMSSYSNRENMINVHKPPKLSMESLQRSLSDISFELSKEDGVSLPTITELEDAKCECCGMSEECTSEYIDRVRRSFSGKLVCGLCAEAVSAEMEKNGGKREEALNDHMSDCVRFNRVERKNPVLFQAEAIKVILKKSSRNGCRAKSISPKSDYNNNACGPRKPGLARSSSCIPTITKERSEN